MTLGFSAFVFLLLLVLKLIGYIDWSWWWITLPMWGGLVVWLRQLMAFSILLAGLQRSTKRKQDHANSPFRR